MTDYDKSFQALIDFEKTITIFNNLAIKNMRVLIVVTSISQYQNHNVQTGLWLSEVTHLYDECKKNKIEIDFASPKGGKTPIDPESLKPLVFLPISVTRRGR